MKSIHHLSREEQQNYIRCPHCKEYIDLHYLKNALDHMVGKCMNTSHATFYLKLIIVQPFEEIIGDHVLNLN